MQNCTLKARLKRLRLLGEFGEEFGVGLDERKLRDAEVKVLREFYSEDPLAYDVAGGRDSYRERIGPIEKKYGSFLKRIFAPRKDETFDQGVMRVLGSMNNVGEAHSRPEQFTTDVRGREIRRFDKLTLGVGAVIGFLMGTIVYKMSGGSVEAYMHALPEIGFAMPYVVIKPTHSPDMKISLNYLRDAAQKTDEFLRQHYV